MKMIRRKFSMKKKTNLRNLFMPLGLRDFSSKAATLAFRRGVHGHMVYS